MEGPTPVSALIHAATMVTAGVYLMMRVYPVLEVADPAVYTVIAWVGGLTALFAATIAVIRRIEGRQIEGGDGIRNEERQMPLG